MTESWHYRCADVCVLPHIGQGSRGEHKADFPNIKNLSHVEYEGYDGWYNNRAHPDWGGVGMSIFLILHSVSYYTAYRLHSVSSETYDKRA